MAIECFKTDHFFKLLVRGERVLSSPALPIFSGHYENNSSWLFLRAGFTLSALNEFEKQALSLLSHVLIHKNLAVLRFM